MYEGVSDIEAFFTKRIVMNGAAHLSGPPSALLA